ncbi:MAG TPA: response regulator transcription factor [Anaerolineaceae bacterium]|nr:response regulator transcription factor [Anaerolineaceae bacterium]
MENQLVTVRGIYQNGQIEIQSPFLPKGGYHVLITFLEPIEAEAQSQSLTGARVERLGLSKKEFEILKLIQKGMTNRQISEKMELGEGTVRNYISSVLNKLKVDNRTQLVNKAIELGLVDPMA